MELFVVKYLKYLILILAVAVFSSCASSTTPVTDKAKGGTSIDGDTNMDTVYRDKVKRLEQDKIARDKYTEMMKTAKTVDEVDKARQQLADVQEEIEMLEIDVAPNETETQWKKKQTVVYGPLGWVLVGTEWILKKLFVVVGPST